MPSLAPVISSTGITAPSYAEILASLQASVRSIYGSDIYIDSDSQDGQMLAIIASAIHDENDAIVAAYNSFSPVTAQGVGLSSVVKINGLRRLVPSNSTATVTLTGTAGTQVNNGQIADTVGNRWALPATVTIGIGGTVDVTATAVDSGDIAASTGTLINIVTPTRGWQSVTNAAPAVPGNPTEDDATLRQRQAVSTAVPALSVLDAILGAIKNLTGVQRATIYENDSGAPDGNGIPGHSISAVVQGGDVDEIANTILLYKTPGTGTYGSESIPVIDPAGVPNTINFYQLTTVVIKTIVYLTSMTGYVSTTGVAIQESVAAWLSSLAIGGDSQLSKLWSPVNLTGDAAIEATGFLQTQLDALSPTYNATAIYQAAPDMTITGGPYVAGVNVVNITNTANLAIGKLVALVLDDGSILLTSITNKVGTVITMANNIPVARSATNGSLMYVAGDIVIAFNTAATAVAADTELKVS